MCEIPLYYESIIQKKLHQSKHNYAQKRGFFLSKRVTSYNTGQLILNLTILNNTQRKTMYYSHTVFLSALLLEVFAKSWKATISLIMSVRLPIHSSARNNSAPTGRIFMKFDI